ncbi:hypothetical protein BCR12_02625 [Limnothrix sp. P13C2]|nr:hypothetical protein BCR12_02625 [Limnothrix sp. P13C2]
MTTHDNRIAAAESWQPNRGSRIVATKAWQLSHGAVMVDGSEFKGRDWGLGQIFWILFHSEPVAWFQYLYLDPTPEFLPRQVNPNRPPLRIGLRGAIARRISPATAAFR